MKIKYAAMLALSLFLTGCDNAPKFDGSSPEALRYSGEKVLETLSPEKKAELTSAISDALSYYGVQAMLSNDKSYSPEKMRLTVLNGKTADEVISDAASYREKKEKLVKEFTQKN